MADFQLSSHAKEMLQERGILEEWVRRALDSPDRKLKTENGNIHHVKSIPEREGRFLRVVVNPRCTPKRVLTVFFDRRLGKKL